MECVLNVKDLRTFFYTRGGIFKSVNGVSFSLKPGEILGVVGESGCGKSITALSCLRLVPHPGKIISGQVLLDGRDLFQLPMGQMRQIRGDRISMIFQEPMISLNPAFKIANQLIEALIVHRQISKSEARNRAIDMLRKVEIPAPEKRIDDYPHQLSGGMRQRVMIAEALLLEPKVLLADEPTTALDATIQAQVLDIMYKLTQEIGTSILFITHNLGLIAEYAQRVAVMYAGKLVEQATVESIFENAGHPYTQGLLRSIPQHVRGKAQKGQPIHEIGGIVPSLADLPKGCSFHPRCPAKKEICWQEDPPWIAVEPEHYLSCWLYS